MSIENFSAEPKNVLITGAAGFIGFHLAKRLKERGDRVYGCDNFNNYYSVALKKARVAELDIPVIPLDISLPQALDPYLEKWGITHLVHLAAQAGIRYSMTNPDAFLQSNMVGFFHILETVRQYPHIRLVYASSSSVYGLNRKTPFSESDNTDSPANFYGATKKSNELMATSYHHLYGLSMTGLRFFTVYGPWGRPDMACYLFTKAIDSGKPIKLFNRGKMRRDFTYIDDIIDGTVSALDRVQGHSIYNLGNSQPEEVEKLVQLIESRLGKQAIRELLPMPPGEISETCADISKAQTELGFEPKITLQEGVGRFLDWYLLNQFRDESSPARLVTCP